MKYILFFLLTFNLYSFDAVLDIEKDVETKAKISLMEDSSTAGSSVNHSKMFKILLNDLKISGHFMVDSKFRKGNFDDTLVPVAVHDSEYLLKYRYGASGTKLNVKLIRVVDSSVVFQNNYSIHQMARYPFLAHSAVVEFNSVLGFEDISWMKRNILFSKYIGSRNSEIWVADYTLSFASVILRGGLNLFPKWANSAQSAFYYTSYNLATPTLYRVNMNSGSRKKVISSEGMLVASDVSKDGSRVLLTMAPHGQPDIYEFNVKSKSKKRLTTFSGIDVNGKYIGDESQIAFVSDRVGNANIYIKSIGSRSVSRVARYGNNNSSCDAFGHHLLYSVKEGSSTNIYLGSVSSSYVRPLTSNGRNQLPRFSADGKVILYIKQNGGKNSIGYMNLATKQSALFPMKSGKIQSIDW